MEPGESQRPTRHTDRIWTLRDEKRFIDGLGTWKITNSDREYAALLAEYIRVKQDLMDREVLLVQPWLKEAMAYADMKLSREVSRG
jgi:hypothetical protein